MDQTPHLRQSEDVAEGRALRPGVLETPTPEPTALLGLGSGIAMLALLHRRRRHSVKR